jgi:hypothetical protein
VLDGASSDPATATNGEMYYNTSLNVFRCYENSTWINCTSRPAMLRVADARSLAVGATITQTMDKWTFTFTKSNSYEYGAKVRNNDTVAHTISAFAEHITPSGTRYADSNTQTVAAGALSSELETAGSSGDYGISSNQQQLTIHLVDAASGAHWVWESFYNSNSSSGWLTSEIKRI